MSITSGTILRIVASLAFPDSVIAQNVFYAVLTGAGPWDEDDIVSDAIDYMDIVFGAWDAMASDDVDLDLVQVYEYDPVDEDWDEVGSGAGGVTGQVSGDRLPHGVAAYTQAKTTDPDVSAAKYWTGFCEVSQANGVWAAGTLTDLGLTAAAWIAGDTGSASGAVFEAGVWSVKNENFYAFNGNLVVNAIPAYQRRRKPGVGS